MCKVEMLRALLNQRLSAAVDEVLVLFLRTIAEYEEELCRTKEENKRQRQLLDAIFKPQPALHIADVNQDLHLEQHKWSSRAKQEEPEATNIKEEEEGRKIAQEAEQLQVKCPVICVPVKSEDYEDDSQSEKNSGAVPPSSSSSQRMTTGDDRGSQADHRLAPLSDHNDTTSDTGDEHAKGNKCRTGETHPRCPQCGKTFARKRNLKEHMMIHTGEKPFVCSFCGKGFSQKVNMITHVRTHTGEKPFYCVVCSKGFRGKSLLTRHIRTHTGEKVFSCSMCGQRFSYKYQLDKHTCTGECNRT
uniref:C2H2-type domain-containing protein n=1 Tax=Hippocampus comes TaxID=109280 RepID=A0A3Q2YD13_HIPCM